MGRYASLLNTQWTGVRLPDQNRQSREDGSYQIAVVFAPQTARRLAAMRETTGASVTDYIRLAVWQALERDGIEASGWRRESRKSGPSGAGSSAEG